MKMTKKKILAFSLIVCVVAIISAGSLAWFTDSESVTNDFMITDSTIISPEEQDIFSIDLYEEYDSDGDGTNERYDTGITYTDFKVYPGAELQKEVYIQNTGYYDQYVRVIVTVSAASVWKDVLGITSINEYVDLTKYFVVDSDFDNIWVRNDIETAYDPTEDTLTYVYYYNDKLEVSDGPVSFMDAVIIPETMNQEHAAAMGGSFAINIVAEAVQTMGVLDQYGTVEYQNAIDTFEAIK